MFNFLDLSGVGNSGKSAVIDLLKEVDCVEVSDTTFEFDLLRVHGGILDLRNALVNNWSPIRSNEALKTFKCRAKMMGLNPKWYDLLGLINSTSQRYDAYFKDQFLTKVEEFCNSLTIGTYTANWPYDRLSQNAYLRFLLKILSRLGVTSVNESKIFLVSGSEFDHKARSLIESLYESRVTSNKKWVTLNNGFEPYNPLPFFEMLPGAKQIVILRDPRDIYVSGKKLSNANVNDRVLLTDYSKKIDFSFLGGHDIQVFVKRFDLYRRNVMRQPHENVLHINFEDLCFKYEETCQKIFIFLGVDPSHHSKKKFYFIPEKSANNVELWKRYSNKTEIDYIEKELSSFLYAPFLS